MKNWRLGLDLGTNSIGWSVLELNDNKEPLDLIDTGVRIFSDGRDPKTKEPLAVARRTARGIRRNIYRKKIRRRRLFKLLQEQKLFPAKRCDAQLLKNLDPYELRVKALDQILQPEELGRVIFHLGVRRGFKSNRKDVQEETTNLKKDRKETEIAKISQSEKCENLANAIVSSGYRTLGEFLFNKRKEGEVIRFVPAYSQFYPLRSLYKEEFDIIRKKQEKKYTNLDWDAIEKAIFFQRPLRPQERGKCQFMPDHERTFKAMPSSNLFRILQDVNNLIMYNEFNEKLPVSDDQVEKIICFLDKKEKASFDQIRKHLKIKYRFNLETENRVELKGNGTAVKMRNPKLFGSLWDSLPLQEQDEIVEKMITADEDSEVLDVLKKYNLSEEKKQAILKVQFPSGTTSLCKEFTQLLVKEMKEWGLPYDQACKKLGFNHYEQKVESYDILPYYGKVLVGSTMGGDTIKYTEAEPEKKYGKIGNPTVHVALNQTRVVVNALIKQYGKPLQISIELTRDLKTSKDSKIRIAKAQAINAKKNIELNKNIQDLNPHITYPSRFERQKFKLWEELGNDGISRCCLYCGKNISASELFSPNIEVEHILPFSRTLLDNESNKTVAHASCNAVKGNRSPYEAFSSSPKGFIWEDIMARVRSLSNKTKQSRFSQDAMEFFEKESSFISRQLTDNAYISRVSLRYLKSICPDVWAVNGAMTKLLRDRWDIDSILKKKISQKEIDYFGLKDDMIGIYKKNRFDHRHHALDSVVIALMDRSMVQKVATLNARKYKPRLEIPAFPIDRANLIKKIQDIVVSFKPEHGVEGKLSKETHLGKIKITERIPTTTLKQEELCMLRDSDIKNLIKQKLESGEIYKKIIEEISKESPEITIFREKFVNRVPILSIESEKNIATIVDPIIREKLQTFIAINKDRKFKDLLLEFSSKNKIKKVRCVARIQTPIIIKPKKYNPLSVHRYLNPEDYFTAIIWEVPAIKEGKKNTYQAQYVLRTDVNEKNMPLEMKPHPAAKKICVLYKKDYIEFSENGIWKKARIAGYSATKNQLDIRPIFSTNSIKDWIITTSEQCLEKGWKSAEDKNCVSVNVLFGSMSARKITVNPIGKVFRK
jgi:CRISPR-associated endonuclease Csn1